VLALLVCFLGITAIRVMPADFFPAIDIPVVTVIWQYTGLSTPEMEQRVTTYSEYAISTSVAAIKDIEAQTLNGISVQKIFFQPDVNLDLAISETVAATTFIRVLLPDRDSGADRRAVQCFERPGAANHSELGYAQ
jgi:multidrug efflux pump subunit AcrB